MPSLPRRFYILLYFWITWNFTKYWYLDPERKYSILIGLGCYLAIEVTENTLSYSMRSQDWGALVSSKFDFPVTTFSLILLPYIYLMSLKLACWCNLLGIGPLHLSQNLLSAPVSENRGLTSNPGTICWIIWIKYLVITNYFTYYVILFFLHTSSNILNSRYNYVAFIFVSQQPWILNCQWIFKWLNRAVHRKLEQC